MKAYEDTCNDCPSRALFPELAFLLNYFELNDVDFLNEMAEMETPLIYGAVQKMKKQQEEIEQLKERLSKA